MPELQRDIRFSRRGDDTRTDVCGFRLRQALPPKRRLSGIENQSLRRWVRVTSRKPRSIETPTVRRPLLGLHPSENESILPLGRTNIALELAWTVVHRWGRNHSRLTNGRNLSPRSTLHPGRMPSLSHGESRDAPSSNPVPESCIDKPSVMIASRPSMSSFWRSRAKRP